MLGSTISYFMTICGSISCLGSGFVIIFYLSNYHTLHKSIYNTVIYYMCICDFFSSLGGSFGYVQEGTFLCDLQAILTNVFPLASVFWLTILIYIYLKLLTSHESIHIIHTTTHIFCWGFPLLLTFLPLTTNKFGILGGEIGWCWLDERSNTPNWTSFFWNVISFYLWIWLAIGVYLLFYFYILYEIKTRYETFSSSENILRTLHKISLYPLSVVMCWLIPCIYDQIDYYASDHTDASTTNNLIFSDLSSITPLLQGTLTCLIFVSTNSEMILASWKQFSAPHQPPVVGVHELSDPDDTSAQISSSRISSFRLQSFQHTGATTSEHHRTDVIPNPLIHHRQQT
jgi:hypothetical protein